MKVSAVFCFFLATCTCVTTAQTKLSIDVKELRSDGQGLVETHVGDVFDPRNLLRIRIAYPSAKEAVVGSGGVNALRDVEQLLATATALTNQLVAAKSTPGLTTSNQVTVMGATATKELAKISELRPDLYEKLADEVEKVHKTLAKENAAIAVLIPYEEIVTAMKNVAVAEQARLKAELTVRDVASDSGKVNATLTVVQMREQRQGRYFAKDLFDLLSVTQEELDAAKGMTPDKLQESLNKWYADEVVKLKTQYTDKVKPAYDKIVEKLGPDSDAAKAVSKLVADIDNLTLGNALQVVSLVEADYQAAVAALRVAPTGLEDAFDKLKTEVDALFLLARSDIATILQIGQLKEIGKEVKDLILGAGESATFTIGQTGDLRKPDIVFDIQNSDAIRILVTEQPADDAKAKEHIDLDMKVWAYKQGYAPIRTITFDGFYKDGTTQLSFAPAVNFLYKRYDRNLANNKFGSVGFGATWFPIGLDQQASGSNQLAIGPSLSLLDDWLSIGYARNFTTNKWFFFAGINLPVKF